MGSGYLGVAFHNVTQGCIGIGRHHTEGNCFIPVPYAQNKNIMKSQEFLRILKENVIKNDFVRYQSFFAKTVKGTHPIWNGMFKFMMVCQNKSKLIF